MAQHEEELPPELRQHDGAPVAEQQAPFNGTSPEMLQLGAYLREQGMYALINWNNLFTNPPLCITEAQLRESFAIIDRALEITDAAVTGS